LNLFNNGDFNNADEWTWNRLEISRWDDVTGADFQFVVFREKIVLGGVMGRSETPPLLLMLDMLEMSGRKEQASYAVVTFVTKCFIDASCLIESEVNLTELSSIPYLACVLPSVHLLHGTGNPEETGIVEI